MANARGKTVDTTFLSLDVAEERGFIHRDYIAHCMRWSHVVKHMLAHKTYETARILDVGCGRELPFAKTLYSSRLIVKEYLGVDYGPIEPAAFHTGKFPLTFMQRTDIMDVYLELNEEKFNHVVCFEMLEHIEPSHVVNMLNHLKGLTTDECDFFFSTPCWNRTDCAANHVNEMLYEALGSLFEKLGYSIIGKYGTFASIRDYEHLLTPEQRQIFLNLRDYYDVNFLSCIMAPMFPAQSRNVLWHLKKDLPNSRKERVIQFPKLEDIPTPWTSSHNWKDLNPQN